MNLYRKGAQKERDIVNACREKGLIAFRSAGSHSPIDVCAIDREKHRIYFIQSKSDNMPESQKKKIEEKFLDLNDMFEVSFEVR